MLMTGVLPHTFGQKDLAQACQLGAGRCKLFGPSGGLTCTTIALLVDVMVYNDIVPIQWIEYGFGNSIVRSPYIPYSIYLRHTVTSYQVLWYVYSDCFESTATLVMAAAESQQDAWV